MLKNWCCWTMVLQKTLESPLDCKEIQPVHPKGDQSWVFTGRTDAEAETPVLWPPHTKSWLWKRPWCWEGLGAGGEGDDREWDGWMASPTRWAWVWVNSGSWWWTERPGVLWFTGSQRVGLDWVTELNWTEKDVRESVCGNSGKVSFGRQCAFPYTIPMLLPAVWNRDAIAGAPATYYQVILKRESFVEDNRVKESSMTLWSCFSNPGLSVPRLYLQRK